LLLLAQGNPSLFAPFMAEALKQPRFAQETAFLDLILEEAADFAPEPFAEILQAEDEGDPALQANREVALGVLRRMAPERIPDRHKSTAAIAITGRGTSRMEAADGRDRASLSGAARETLRTADGGVELVYIPGGRFRMGSPDGMGDDDERPAHEASIRPFYLGRYPVTNEEYARFLKAHPEVEQPACWADRRFNQGRQPAVGVNWEQARRFARWAGGRLPSEAEWEYAARAGSVTEYFWGESAAEADEYAWHSGNSRGATHPVGEKRPNAFGLHDMAGNVWEWVQDRWHENYRGAPADGAAWEEGESARRVVRGGAWSDVPQLWRSANRDRYWLGGAGNVLGFRLARDI
jgi:formylglycine-generating enzyme required for sulfatase activity